MGLEQGWLADTPGLVRHPLVHLPVLLVGEVAQHGEHGAAAEEADEGVHQGDYQCVSEDWTSELVVAAERDQRTEGNSHRVKNLKYFTS